MDKKNFVLALDRLAATFGTQLTPARYEAYWEVLGDMPDAVFIAACRKCREEEAFFPIPATIIRHARGMATDEEAGEREWLGVLKVAQSWSPLRAEATFAPATATALRAIGGIRTLALSETKEHPWLRKEFLAAYAVAAVRDADDRLGIGSGEAARSTVRRLPERSA